MKLPDPSRRFTLVPFPGIADPRVLKRWRRLDERIRTHNMARSLAAIDSPSVRIDQLEQLLKIHGKTFIQRLRRLVRWYWRAQRKLPPSASWPERKR